MKMKSVMSLAGLLLCSWIVAGCNVGNAPSGSADDVKTAYEAMSPADKIKFIQSSPMPADEKAKRIKEIEDKSGVKATDGAGPVTAH